MLKNLKEIDLFGMPIPIFHKKRKAYHSKIGGCITIWFICSILTYAGWRFSTLLNREGDTITMGSLYYNTAED